MEELKSLEIYAVIGFDGSTPNSLKCHPNGTHIVYPMGNKICIQNWHTKKMDFLIGHTNLISAINISPGGKYIGSGQVNTIGFKSLVILWDYQTKQILAKHEFHMVRVESLVFSCDDSFMISIGGQDCGQLCVWDVALNSALCTNTAAKVTTGYAVILASMNKIPNLFVTGGDYNLRVWNINETKKTASVTDVSMGKLKRYIKCVTISSNDEYGYCGTTSGDIIKIKFDYANDSNEPMCKPSMVGCLAKCGKWKKNATHPETVSYSLGVCCIIILQDESLIVGAGDGTIDHLEEMKWAKPLPKSKLYSPVSPHFKLIKTKKLNGSITSMQIMESSNTKKDKICLVSTKTCEIFMINLNTFQISLLTTCHTSAVNEIAFPYGMSEVFATAGTGDVRVWCLKTCQELLRIQVANFVCTSVLFSNDGKLIISGWDDGCIRAFTPLSGQLVFCILNTHNKGTSALAITSDGKTLISGGCEGQVLCRHYYSSIMLHLYLTQRILETLLTNGQRSKNILKVRVWSIEPEKQTLKAVLKEHKCPVSAIRVNNTNTEAVSAGSDGSCIIWDIIKLCRRQIMFANTVFSCVCYEPNGSQVITVGTDRRVAYWETGSGVLLRELEASRNGAINALHINNSGESFVTGGNDQIVKLWKYHDGIYTHIGSGHFGTIKTVRFSHNGNYIVSASEAGDIFIWKCPSEHKIEMSVPSSATSKKSSPRIPSKFSPHKQENISTINTARSSVITNQSCTCNEKSKLGNTSKATCNICHSKNNKKSLTPTMCTPPISAKE